MGQVRWFDDPSWGLQTGMVIDPVTDEITIVHRENVDSVIKANKQAMNVPVRRDPDEMYRHVARIPQGIYMYWLKHLGVDVLNNAHQDKVLNLLDDPHWSYLRVTPGKYSRKVEKQYFHRRMLTTNGRRAASLIGRSNPGAPKRAGGLM